MPLEIAVEIGSIRKLKRLAHLQGCLTLRQVHGSRVAIIDRAGMTREAGKKELLYQKIMLLPGFFVIFMVRKSCL